MMKRGFDYVVIGAGTAGCVLASRLSEDRSAKVCVIEAGGRARGAKFAVPLLSALAAMDKSRQWDLVGEPEASLLQRRLPLVQAKAVGGGSAINAMIYTRGHSQEYAAWNCPQWEFKELLPYYKRSENSERGSGPWHGDAGPVRVMRGRPLLDVDSAFMDAAAASGHRLVDDLNADVDAGFAHLDYTIAQGRRCGAARAFLDPALARSNLTLLSERTVQRILIEQGRATGVVIQGPAGQETITVDGEIILCAGAIHSPRLLLRSGIGAADALRNCGVTPRVDLPEVGRNLQNHIRYALSVPTRGLDTAYGAIRPARLARSGAAYAFSRTGFLTEPPFSIGGHLRTDPDLALSDVKVTLARGMPGAGKGALAIRPRAAGFTILFHQGRPHSRGSVFLQPSEPDGAPVIQTNYFSDERDMEVLLAGLDKVLEIVSARPLAPYLEDLSALRALSDKAFARESALANVAGIFHPVGTCRMGPDRGAVVDERLRVRGTQALRVADASVIPRLMSVNTNAPAMMIAERAADFIRADRKALREE